VTALATGTRIGKYELGEKLGHGGYGIVYAARDVELDRTIAIKVLRSDYLTHPQVMQRFLQEARSAAKIVHPGIVTVYAADGTIFIAMELLSGVDLGTRLEDTPQLAIDHTIELGVQLASALEAAHKSGVVHRDLKPDNIFLVPDASVAGGERVKILDFGIAKLADKQRVATIDGGQTGVHTHSMMMLGTPRYMSPEQCKSSARVDHRSDIYTLGCMLYQLLTGHSPYDGDAGELIARHQLAPIPRVRAERPEVPAHLDVLISTMLAKEPKDRPPTMERVREELEACASGKPLGDLQPDLTTPDFTPSVPDATPGAEARGVDPTASVRIDPRKLPPMRWIAAGLATIAIGMTLGVLAARHDHDGTEHASAGPSAPSRLPSPAPAIAAPAAATGSATPVDVTAKEQECRGLAADRRWTDVLRCADDLARVLPSTSPLLRELTTMSVIEARNETVSAKVSDAIAARDLAEAYRWLDRIDDESIYKEEASEKVDQLAAAMPRQALQGPNCNADRLAGRAQQAITEGQYTSALALLEGSLRCRPDPSMYRLALLAACNAGNTAKAKLYFAKLAPNQQTTMAQLCMRNKIALP
jgi:serine/threonine protein kinase